MFFKKLFILVLIASTGSACSWLRDKPKAQKTFESGQLDLSCLKIMPDQLQNLFAGKYGESANDLESIQSIWTCLDRSLNTFSKYTHGANQNYYTGKELQSFANRYLPEDNLFSKSLVDSIFNLKTAVLGGNNDHITQEEITKLRGKLNRFGEMILPLAPYISTLLKPFEPLSEGRTQIAGQRLNQFVFDIADLLGDSENTVTWKDLSFFVGELEKYLKSPNPTALTVIREQIQVFQYMKTLVVGGDESGIEKSKWHPILKSISIIYNALYLTTSTNEMMEQLGLEIQSTNEEQKKATEMLTLVLKKLKRDQGVYTKSTISLLSDRWAKALILNAFLYPNSEDKLSIKNFFGSPALRRISGFLFDDMTKIINGDRSDALIEHMAENLTELFEKAREGNPGVLNIQNLRNFNSRLKLLFTDESDYNSIDLIFTMLDDISAIMVGKESGKMTSRDFRVLIEKSRDLYLAWSGEKAKDFNKSLAESMNIIIRRPSAGQIQIDRIRSLLSKAEKLFSTMKFSAQINWVELDKMVLDGARLKSVLFSNTDKIITISELTQIHNTWKAFNEKPELDDALENLANYFKINPYSSVKLKDLYNAIDSFLPETKKLDKLGIKTDLIGPLKSFLIGGSPLSLDKNEYSKIAQIGFTIYRNLKPVLETLPKDYSAGLNSQTIAIIEAIVQGMVDGEDYKFSNIALKDLLLSQLKGPGIKVTPQTIDRLLIALNFRVLDHNKGPKPSSYPAFIPSWKLVGIRDMLKLVKLNFQDFEDVFKGLELKQSLSGKSIHDRLSRQDSRFILDSIHSIINGETGMPYFTSNGGPYTDYYLDDLRYKSLIYQSLLWVLPAYEVEPDPDKPSALPRLSINDLYDLFDDINDAVYELGVSFSADPVKVSADRRMQSINLFTRTGNGDEYIDVMETVDFLTTTFSGKNLFDEVRRGLVRDCYGSNLTYKSQDKFSISCLENHFFEKGAFNNYYNKVIPKMNAHYMGLGVKEQNAFIDSIMTAATSPDWRKAGDLPLNDLETLISTPYYAENIFLRLDSNFNDVLVFTEAMKGFPIFCRAIKKAAGDSISGSCEEGQEPKQIEAIYGHLLMKGVPPRSIKPGDSIIDKIVISKEFLYWVTKWKFMSKKSEDRDVEPPNLKRRDLLGIIANLSTSITVVDPVTQP